MEGEISLACQYWPKHIKALANEPQLDSSLATVQFTTNSKNMLIALESLNDNDIHTL